jgi:hypothetical protein
MCVHVAAELEYLMASFGTWAPFDTVEVVVVQPASGCGELAGSVEGKAVLVQRGKRQDIMFRLCCGAMQPQDEVCAYEQGRAHTWRRR